MPALSAVAEFAVAAVDLGTVPDFTPPLPFGARPGVVDLVWLVEIDAFPIDEDAP